MLRGATKYAQLSLFEPDVDLLAFLKALARYFLAKSVLFATFILYSLFFIQEI